ncbi:FIST N-terminal domain-containing protein [Hyphomonas sp.]|uniref:FIST signal transduction protein n=1 Tax=Hyphomonas sp. TaxID=87 RepID=UPI0025BBA3A9|nr:FIST N-terminal domain-containing protein [Hyphomonas sp.]
MKFKSAISSESDTAEACESILGDLLADRSDEPDLLFVFASCTHNIGAIRQLVSSRLPDAQIHGGTSCRGSMNEERVELSGGFALSALAVWDPDGAYGSSARACGDNPKLAARQALLSALEQAGRPGEVPDLVWLTAAPGQEELAVEAIKEVVGDRALIVGGSSADNDISGQWCQFTREAQFCEGLAVTAMFITGAVSSVFQCGYASAGRSGRVTKSDKRRLYEIDHRPAGDVYFDWSDRPAPHLTNGDDPKGLLPDSTLIPLGKVSGDLASVPFHLLLHPAAVHADGSLDLFADVQEGDEVFLMQGTKQSIVARAGRLACLARADLQSKGAQCSCALIVFCGGCMLAVEEEMETVRRSIADTLGPIPFLVMFSFGEQGQVLGGQSQHANLMISCTIFGNPAVVG